MTEMCATSTATARNRCAPRGPIGVATTAVLAILVATACTAGGASPSPTPEPTAELGSPVVGTPAGSGAPSEAPGRTTTDWGVIWDAVPASFPLPSGVAPADLPDGPVSGTYTTSTAASATADAIATGLRAGGYSTVVVSGPTEAGEVTIDAVGSDAGCRIRATVRPLGGLTAIVVLYGSGCPYR